MAGRKEDRLLISQLKALSRSLGYEDKPRRTGPERLMRHIHLHQNRIRYGCEEFRAKAVDLIDPRFHETAPERITPDFMVFRGSIVLDGEGLSNRDPLLILEAFNEANKRGLSLGSGFIWEARKKIALEGKRLRDLPGARELFLNLVLEPENIKIIRLALEMGLIEIFIPEFKRIRNLAQFGYYHVETMDIHALKTLEVLNGIASGEYDIRWPLFRQVFDGLKNPDWLFLAGLLHDIGKGYAGDHALTGAEIVPPILNRLGISGEALQVIPLLIRHHLLLTNISQRRDLNDEKTSVQVAQTVQDVDTLGLLFLLTLADSLATGPMAASDWKISLLVELFSKVRHILERGLLASPDATRSIAENRKKLFEGLKARFPKQDVHSLGEQASTRYFLYTPLDDMILHFSMALTMGREKLVWTLQQLKKAPVTRVVLCSYDRPGLFSKLVGIFTLNNIQVLSANIFTLKNGLAFDTYEVTNPLDPYRSEEIWARIRSQIIEAVEDKLPLDDMVDRKLISRGTSGVMNTGVKKWVHIDNQASDFFTCIEVSAAGRLRLLYELAKKIYALGLDIRFAKVNRDEEKMTGVFYVRDEQGQKIYDPFVIEKTRDEIHGLIR